MILTDTGTPRRTPLRPELQVPTAVCSHPPGGSTSGPRLQPDYVTLPFDDTLGVRAACTPERACWFAFCLCALLPPSHHRPDPPEPSAWPKQRLRPCWFVGAELLPEVCVCVCVCSFPFFLRGLLNEAPPSSRSATTTNMLAGGGGGAQRFGCGQT